MRPVLLVRPDRNDADAAALADLGVPTIVDPYLRVAPVADPTAAIHLLASLETAGKGWWLVVTSPRAWGAWRAIVTGSPAPVRPVGGARPVPDPTAGAVVGPSSRTDQLAAALARARDRGLRVAATGPSSADSVPGGADLVAGTPSAAWLTTALRAAGGHTAVLPGSGIARPEPAADLIAAGWTVHAGAVYDTVARLHRPDSADLVESGGVGGVLLRSPSAASAVDRLVRVPSGLPVFAAGATTLASCPPGWTVIEVPTTPAAATASAIRKEV